MTPVPARPNLVPDPRPVGPPGQLQQTNYSTNMGIEAGTTMWCIEAGTTMGIEAGTTDKIVIKQDVLPSKKGCKSNLQIQKTEHDE